MKEQDKMHQQCEIEKMEISYKNSIWRSSQCLGAFDENRLEIKSATFRLILSWSNVISVGKSEGMIVLFMKSAANEEQEYFDQDEDGEDVSMERALMNSLQKSDEKFVDSSIEGSLIVKIQPLLNFEQVYSSVRSCVSEAEKKEAEQPASDLFDFQAEEFEMEEGIMEQPVLAKQFEEEKSIHCKIKSSQSEKQG